MFLLEMKHINRRSFCNRRTAKRLQVQELERQFSPEEHLFKGVSPPHAAAFNETMCGRKRVSGLTSLTGRKTHPNYCISHEIKPPPTTWRWGGDSLCAPTPGPHSQIVTSLIHGRGCKESLKSIQLPVFCISRPLRCVFFNSYVLVFAISVVL